MEEYDVDSILDMYEEKYVPEPGTKKYDYKNPLQKNQYVIRTDEEIQAIINDPKYKDYTRKDFRNEGILSRKETERETLEFKNFGKKKKKPANLENIKRDEKIKKTQGSNISVRGSGQTGKQFSHVYPLIESAKPGTKTTFTIDAKMNRALEGYNKIGQSIAEQQEFLIKNKPEGYKNKLVELNAKAKKNVMNAIDDLGKEYKGQIGYFQVDPDTGEFKPKAGNYKMSFAGIEGKNEIYKDMTGKERKDFERKISAIENAKKTDGVTLGSNFGNVSKKLAARSLGDLAISLGSPTALLGLNAYLGVDPRESLDRAILGTEAALAPAGLKALMSRLDNIKNPIVRKSIETAAGLRLPGVFTPANVMKVARFASPVGIATLAGEGLYQLGKLGYKEQQMIDEMRENDPEAYQRYLAEQQELADVSA